MIPLKDNVPSRNPPVVNWLLIGACTLVFLLQVMASFRQGGENAFVMRYAMVPKRLHAKVTVIDQYVVQTRFGPAIQQVERELPGSILGAWLTPLTCIFLHGGWMHFLGNMWFLYIFGDNVEDRFGSIPYLIFYIGCGVAASLMHLIFNFNSMIPTLGASGAIAGVMGAYMVFYPRALVVTLVPLVFLFPVIILPAPVFLGIWFVMQLYHGTLGMFAGAAGVAWWAHVGGFGTGYLVAKEADEHHRLNPRVDGTLPRIDHIGRFYS